jgi:hypothetical protein
MLDIIPNALELHIQPGWDLEGWSPRIYVSGLPGPDDAHIREHTHPALSLDSLYVVDRRLEVVRTWRVRVPPFSALPPSRYLPLCSFCPCSPPRSPLPSSFLQTPLVPWTISKPRIRAPLMSAKLKRTFTFVSSNEMVASP